MSWHARREQSPRHEVGLSEGSPASQPGRSRWLELPGRHGRLDMKARYMKLPPCQPGRCRICGLPVPRGRRTFCSEACVEHYRIRAWPQYARQVIWERDGGRCERCGLSVRKIHSSINRKARTFRDRRAAEQFSRSLSVGFSHQIRNGTKAPSDGRSFGWCWWPGVALSSCWQLDHRIPVAEGGGSCGPENLRILCRWCHRIETAKLLRRQKHTRKDKEEP